MVVAWFLSTPWSACFAPSNVSENLAVLAWGHTNPEPQKTSPEKGRKTWKWLIDDLAILAGQKSLVY